MATIAPTLVSGSGQVLVVQTTLTGTLDTFTYTPGRGQILILRNPTGGAISPVIDGAGGTTVETDRLGTVDVSAGYAVGSIAAGAARAIPLDTISAYLKGVIAINSGADLVGILLSR
jgi:uncharacterized protein RhaS with RHS repeats